MGRRFGIPAGLGQTMDIEEHDLSAILEQWAADQRALARALGLSIEDWLRALDGAARRGPQLTAAAIGAVSARGLPAGLVRSLDGPSLARRARRLIDPRPPRTENPILKEAIRRGSELRAGPGVARLLERRESVLTPRRGLGSIGESARMVTPDAPGDDGEASE